MSILIIGGTGFIGRRLMPLLAQRGEEIVCMDINPQTANFSDLGKQVRVVRGDVTPVRRRDGRDGRREAGSRVINLAYWLGSEQPAAGRLQAQHPRHGQLLRGGAPRRRQPGRLCQLDRGERRAETLRRPASSPKTISATATPVRDAQDLQRVAGAGVSQEARHGDHRDPPGQRHRPRQDRRLGGPRDLHHRPGARQASQVPLQGRDALPGPCRRDRRGLRPRDDGRQAEAPRLQHRRHSRSASASWPTSCAGSCPTRRSPSRRRPAARSCRATT